MVSQNKSCMASFRIFFLSLIVILAVIITRYYLPVHLPGPMVHPLKYKIISAVFALVLDISQFLEHVFGIPYYTTLNAIVDCWDPIKIRPFDHGEVLYHDQYIEHVLVRMYTPQNISNTALLPVVIFFHGGGFFFGSIYSHDTMNYHLSKYTGAKVIAVNYKLTPNVHYPTPIEESVKVTRHVIDNYREYGIDPSHVFLCGDSAGGNLAVVVERHLREKKKSIIRGVLLLYPLLQLVNYRLPSYRKYLPYRILSILREDILTEVANFYINSSFSDDELFHNRHLSLNDYKKFYSKINIQENDDTNMNDLLLESTRNDTWKLFDENVSPLLADDEILKNSPPTFIVSCRYDVLLSDAQLYFQRLEKLNVEHVVYREYQIFHGVMTFVDFPVAFNEAFDIINDSAQFVVNRSTLVK